MEFLYLCPSIFPFLVMTSSTLKILDYLTIAPMRNITSEHINIALYWLNEVAKEVILFFIVCDLMGRLRDFSLLPINMAVEGTNTKWIGAEIKVLAMLNLI